MQLGLTIVFSLVASLISAITLVPLFFKMYQPQQKEDLKINHLLDIIKEKYDHIHLQTPKGKKEIIKSHAEKQGKSLNAFVNEAIDNQMERDDMESNQ